MPQLFNENNKGSHVTVLLRKLTAITWKTDGYLLSSLSGYFSWEEMVYCSFWKIPRNLSTGNKNQPPFPWFSCSCLCFFHRLALYMHHRWGDFWNFNVSLRKKRKIRPLSAACQILGLFQTQVEAMFPINRMVHQRTASRSQPVFLLGFLAFSSLYSSLENLSKWHAVRIRVNPMVRWPFILAIDLDDNLFHP